MRRLQITLGLALFVCLGLPRSIASANDIYATACAGVLDTRSLFSVDEQVCVAGDVDYTCPVRLGVSLPGGDIYVVLTGGDPFTGTPLHLPSVGTFGEFWDESVMTPPLAPGVYDILLDEHCDGIINADDVLKVAAFRVGGLPMCSMPPGPPVDPGIASGSTCRGACGGDCPSSCTPTGPTTSCVDDPVSCQHVECTQSGLSCGTHPGCRTHDDCYDACAASGGGFWCRRQCDVDCIDTYGLPCASWARGGGPYDGTLTFSNPTMSSGALPGSCSGSC